MFHFYALYLQNIWCKCFVLRSQKEIQWFVLTCLGKSDTFNINRFSEGYMAWGESKQCHKNQKIILLRQSVNLAMENSSVREKSLFVPPEILGGILSKYVHEAFQNLHRQQLFASHVTMPANVHQDFEYHSIYVFIITFAI